MDIAIHSLHSLCKRAGCFKTSSQRDAPQTPTSPSLLAPKGTYNLGRVKYEKIHVY
jgi:hypothetical protein